MKITHKITGLIVSLALITPLFAAAQTDTGSTSQIQSLMSQIASLETQLHTLLGSTVGSSTQQMWNASSTGSWMPPAGTSTPPMNAQGMGGMQCPQFTRNLSIGSEGSDVSDLQQTLLGDGFLSASSTTGFFGQLTARALSEFQTHFGITSSSTGFFGALTRNFLGDHCQGRGGQGSGGGQGGGMMGSSTRPMMGPNMPWGQGTSTDGQQGGQGWGPGTSTGQRWNGPMNPAMGSTTPPCPGENMDDSNAAAAALFVPHSIIPMMQMMHPCQAGSQDGPRQ